jgi:hypothetical protein
MAILLADPALADLIGSSSPPSFTREEQVIIDRNPSLREASRSNPWVVRRILDVLGHAPSSNGEIKSPLPPSAERDSDDPDLDRMQRASPEAVHDLFQLLKQAGKKEAK